MRVAFFISEKMRELDLATAFTTGAHKHGIPTSVLSNDATEIPYKTTAACMVGVKSKRLWELCMSRGIDCIMFDKGYERSWTVHKGWDYWRISVNAHHPSNYLMRMRKPHDRSKHRFVEWAPNPSGHVLIAGSSAKYHKFYGLEEPTAYWNVRVREIRRLLPKTKIIYRPKPSWREAEPLENTGFSAARQHTLLDDLSGARLMVTHGSNAVYEAIIAGIPCVSLGPSIAQPISSTRLDDVTEPMMYPKTTVNQWLANIGYCQWTLEEMAQGKAWPELRPYLERG